MTEISGAGGSRPTEQPRNPDDVFSRRPVRGAVRGRSEPADLDEVFNRRPKRGPRTPSPNPADVDPSLPEPGRAERKVVQTWLSEKSNAFANNPWAQRMRRSPQFIKDSVWAKEDKRAGYITNATIALMRAGSVAFTGGLDLVWSAGIGGVAGAARAGLQEVYREFDAQNKQASERMGVERAAAAAEGRPANLGADDLLKEMQARELKFRNLKAKFFALDDKSKVVKAAVRGGLFGAIGGAVGFEMKDWGVVQTAFSWAGNNKEKLAGVAMTTFGALGERFLKLKRNGNISKMGTAGIILGAAAAGLGLGALAEYMGSGVDVPSSASPAVSKPEGPPVSTGASPSPEAPARPVIAKPTEVVPDPAMPPAVPKPSPSPAEAPKPTPLPGRRLNPTSFRSDQFDGGTASMDNVKGGVLGNEVSSSLLMKNGFTSLELNQAARSGEIYDQIVNAEANNKLRLNSAFTDRFNDNLDTSWNSVLDHSVVRDTINRASTEILNLTEPDLRSAVGPEWSSLKGQVEGWIGQDFFVNRDPGILVELEELIKTEQANLKIGEGVFFGDENPNMPEDQKFWNSFKAGNITKFNSYDENHARVLRMMEKLPKGSVGRDLYDRQFLGTYVKFKLDNSEDPTSIGTIFNKDSDYFKHKVDFKIDQPERLLADLRKAA